MNEDFSIRLNKIAGLTTFKSYFLNYLTK